MNEQEHKKANSTFWRAVFVALSLVAIILFCSNCVSEKKRAEICSTCPIKIERHDSVAPPEIKYTPFDTTLFLAKMFGKQIEANNCDSLVAELKRKNNEIQTKENGVTETILRNPKTGALTFKCETDSLKEAVRLLRKEVTQKQFTTITKEVLARCEKRHVTDNEIFWIKVGKWLFGILVAYVSLRLLKAYLKRMFPVSRIASVAGKFIP